MLGQARLPQVAASALHTNNVSRSTMVTWINMMRIRILSRKLIKMVLMMMMMLVIAIVIMMMIKFFRYICNCSVSVRTILATVRHDRTHTQASVLLLLAFRSLLFLHCVCCIWRNYFLHRLHYLVICCIIFVLPPTKDYVLMCTLLWFACNFAFVAFVASHFCIH